MGRVSLILLSACVLWSCGDAVKVAEPPTREKKPMVNPDAGPHGHAGHSAPEGTTPHAQPSHDPFAAAPVSSADAKPAGDPEEVVYSGTVTLAEGVTLPDPCWLWVSAGNPPQGRPPVVTKLYESPEFPLTFELKRKDTAFPGASVPEKADLVLYASVAKNRFVEGIVLRVPPTAEAPMGTNGIAIEIKQP